MQLCLQCRLLDAWACNAALSTSLEPPFRQGGTNLGNYHHSIYNATSSSEHRADFQARQLNARGLQIGGSRKTLANKARGLDIDNAFAHYLWAARSYIISATDALLSATSPPPWHNHLVVSKKATFVVRPPCRQISV